MATLLSEIQSGGVRCRINKTHRKQAKFQKRLAVSNFSMFLSCFSAFLTFEKQHQFPITKDLLDEGIASDKL